MFQVCCATYQHINHPLITRNSPSSLCLCCWCSSCTCGTEEVLRDPLFPWSRGCATPREVNQLLQDANLLEAAHGAAAGRDSANPAGSRDLPQGRASPRRARRSGCSGKVPRQQNGRAGPAQLLLPPPPARPYGSAAPAGQGWELLPRSIAPGSSSCKERLLAFLALLARSAPPLTVPKDRSFAPARVSRGGGEAGDPAGICSGWLMRFLSYCSQKLWEGDGTSERMSDIKTRSPTLLAGISYLPLSWAGCQQDVGVCAIWETPSPP